MKFDPRPNVLPRKLFLALPVIVLLAACQPRPAQPEYLGDTGSQETTHTFKGAAIEAVFDAMKQAYSESGLIIKASDFHGKYVTANRNTGKGFTTSTAYFYPGASGVRVRIVTKSNAGEKALADVNEQVIAAATKKLGGS